MKNILIISYCYPPSNAPAAQRPYATAKHLDKANYKVTVLTCSNAESSLGFDPNLDPELSNVTLLKIKAIFGDKASSFRSKTSTESKQSFISYIRSKILSSLLVFVIPDKAIFWLPKVKSYLKLNPNLIEETDIVISVSPVFTNHLVARHILRKNKKIEWIADFGDFHHIGHENMYNNFVSKIHKKLESSVVESAAKLLFVSNAMKDKYSGVYPQSSSKMNVVYNGVDLIDFKDYKITELEVAELTIFYAGSFYQGVRSPHALFKLLDRAIESNLLKLEEVKIQIAGRIESELIDELRQYSIFTCVEFLGLIPRQDVLKYLTTSTVLWMIVGNLLSHYSSVPLKLFEYMAARRPIVNFAPFDSEASTIINERQLGWNFDPNTESEDEMFEHFKEVIIKYRSGSLKEPLTNKYLKDFSTEVQTKSIETLIE